MENYGRATVSVGVVALCMSSAIYVSSFLTSWESPHSTTEIRFVDSVTQQRVVLAPLEERPAVPVKGHLVPKGLPLECDNTLEHPYLLAVRPSSTIYPSTLYVRCPPSCSSLDGTVYGTSVYAGKSSVCLAAIHSGALDRRGGLAELSISAGGKQRFEGSFSYGINSKALQDQRTKFSIKAADEIDTRQLPTITMGCFANSLDPQLANCSMWLVRCPANCLFTKDKKLLIWGGHPYTSDSSVCLAAIHAGVATSLAPSSFVIEQVGGQEEFRGSTEHGVTSQTWKMFPARFYIYDFGHHVECAATFDSFLTTVEDSVDRTWKIVCPPNCNAGVVYGGEGAVFASASSICRAARHAGFVAEAGGEVNLRRSDGRISPSFLSNGVLSLAHNGLGGSFTLTQTTIALQCGTRLLPEDDHSNMLFTSLPELRVSCPFACERKSGVLKGAIYYSADSSICLAAVHTGVIYKQQGGEFILHKHLNYEGPSTPVSSRNGLISEPLKVVGPTTVFSVASLRD